MTKIEHLSVLCISQRVRPSLWGSSHPPTKCASLEGKSPNLCAHPFYTFSRSSYYVCLLCPLYRLRALYRTIAKIYIELNLNARMHAQMWRQTNREQTFVCRHICARISWVRTWVQTYLLLCMKYTTNISIVVFAIFRGKTEPNREYWPLAIRAVDIYSTGTLSYESWVLSHYSW